MIDICLLEFARPCEVVEWCELNIPGRWKFGNVAKFKLGEVGKSPNCEFNDDWFTETPTVYPFFRMTLYADDSDGTYRIFKAAKNVKTICIDDSDAELLFTLTWL